ncbi:MAG TPA: TerC/Alx family metal homeostasis membrane protein [Candidatus Acidoferrum sp.]|nr:TerC/Alx family metal homeostasis membrane protein [Candidatus Acidoferrum sp.]
MGSLALWVEFNAIVLFLLVLDLSVFHRRAHEVRLREAAAESFFWVALSLGFCFWIFRSVGSEQGLQFLTGYVIEKSLSVDNIFVFVLVFKAFQVKPQYQHRVLFWGVFGALIMRGAMIGLGTALVSRFEWVLYLFGLFLLFAGIRMLTHKDIEVAPDKNPVVRLARGLFPMTSGHDGPEIWIREAGRVVFTPLLLVLLVIETADLVFAADSIPAVIGVTRDPFIVYSSNICAILGLRAFYFLLVGALPYFRYLDEGLSVVLIFIAGKMLAAPWIKVTTVQALGVVAAVLIVAIIASVMASWNEKRQGLKLKERRKVSGAELRVKNLDEVIADLADPDVAIRLSAAAILLHIGRAQSHDAVKRWQEDQEFGKLLNVGAPPVHGETGGGVHETVGIAVTPEIFSRIRAANGMPHLAEVPPDQDAEEFELQFSIPQRPGMKASDEEIRLDILTTKEPGGEGAIARFLAKFGEGIQQVEYQVTDVDRATQILSERFGVKAIYPATRAGADGTRVNFFLIPAGLGKKILIELVEPQQPAR